MSGKTAQLVQLSCCKALPPWFTYHTAMACKCKRWYNTLWSFILHIFPRGELLRILPLCAVSAPSSVVSRQLFCDGHSKTNSWLYLVTGSVLNRMPYVKIRLQKKVNVYVQNNTKIESKLCKSRGQSEQRDGGRRGHRTQNFPPYTKKRQHELNQD